MTDTDFAAMGREQLREYVKTHPKDQIAFQMYMDKLQDEPGVEITSMDQFEQLVQDYIKRYSPFLFHVSQVAKRR
jgi:hypothetical protein